MAKTQKPTLVRRGNSSGAMAQAIGVSIPAPFIPPVIAGNIDQDAMTSALKAGHVEMPVAQMAPPNMADLQVGQVYTVPLYRLQKSDNNARVMYDPAEVDAMSESLRLGQDVPAIGYVRNGKVIVVDGQKRLHAATSGAMESLKVLIKEPPLSDRDEYEESRRINLQRSTQTVFDDCIRWNDMLTKGMYESQDEVADRMGVSKASVSKVLGLSVIPERLIRRMATSEHTRTLSTAYELTSILKAFKEDPEKGVRLTEEVIEQIQRDELNRNQAKALIDSKIAELDGRTARNRERAESSVVKYGETKGTLKVFANRGQLDLSFTGLPPERVEQLKTQIEQMLAGQATI